MTRQGRQKLGKKQVSIGILFMLPAIVMILITLVVPVVWNLVLSFFEWNGNSEMIFRGFDNYIETFTTQSTAVTLWRSVFVSLVSTVIAMGLGILYAFIIYRVGKKEGAVYRFIFFSPAMMPMTVIGLLFTFILASDSGVFNAILELIGLGNLQHAWLAEPGLVLWVIAVIQGWLRSGLIMMMIFAAVISVPNSLLESSKLEGAGYFAQVRLIIMPLIKPTIQMVLSMMLMWGFKTYDMVYAMTKGGPGEFSYTAPLKMMQQGFTFNSYGSAAALGVILTVVVSAFILFARKLLKGEVYEL